MPRYEPSNEEVSLLFQVECPDPELEPHEDGLQQMEGDDETEQMQTDAGAPLQDTGMHSNNRKNRLSVCHEMFQAERENEESLRAPRKREVLMQEKANGELMYVGQTFASQAEAKLCIKEYCEISRCSFKYDRLDPTRVKVIGRRDDCAFNVYISPDTASGLWVLRQMTDHSKDCCGLERAKGESTTPYDYNDLARIPELQEAFKANFNLPFENIARILSDYVAEPMHDSKLSRVRTALRKNLVGNARDAVRTIPALLAALEADGYSTRYIVHTSSVVKRMFLAQMETQHEYQQQKLAPSSRTPWNAEKQEAAKKEVEEMFEGDAEGTLYLVSYSIIFPTAAKMVEDMVPVNFTDGAHMRNVSGGVLYSTLAVDADHHIVPVCNTWHLGAECAAGWSAHLSHVRTVIPSTNLFIIDATKSGMSICRQLGILFLVCSQHQSKNIPNKPDRDAYLRGVHATTLAYLDEQLSKMSPAFRAKLTQYNTVEELFMLKRGKLFGHHCQSIAESFNSLLRRPRTAPHHAGIH